MSKTKFKEFLVDNKKYLSSLKSKALVFFSDIYELFNINLISFGKDKRSEFFKLFKSRHFSCFLNFVIVKNIDNLYFDL